MRWENKADVRRTINSADFIRRQKIGWLSCVTRPILSPDFIGWYFGDKFGSRISNFAEKNRPIKAGDKISRFYCSSVIGLSLLAIVVPATIWLLSCSVYQSSLIRGLVTPWTYFLHWSLSSVILIDPSTLSLVHVLMLFVQAVRGLPLLRLPGIVPCIISFSKEFPCFLMMWPQYASFLAFTKSSNSCVVPAVHRTPSIVFFAVQETRRILLSPFIWKLLLRFCSFCSSFSCFLLCNCESRWQYN